LRSSVAGAPGKAVTVIERTTRREKVSLMRQFSGAPLDATSLRCDELRILGDPMGRDNGNLPG
jgi:hypothetical protein